jgi:aminomuconate-semialdehyde/2-hydroxymuconate-6-semialdehyde dehydrogenase
MLFSKNEERARRIAKQVVAGTVWVNCYFVRELAPPLGGSRNSGMGREGETWNFDFSCDVKHIAALKGSFA